MTSNIQSRRESSAPTKKFESGRYETGTYIQAETNPQRGVVIEFDLSQLKEEILPASFVGIDALVEKSEKDALRRQALEDARRWIANKFYGDEKDTLRVFRLQKGLSQARLASIIGTTQSHVARIESGRCDVQVGTLVRMAKALGLEPTAIFHAFLKKQGSLSGAKSNE